MQPIKYTNCVEASTLLPLRSLCMLSNIVHVTYGESCTIYVQISAHSYEHMSESTHTNISHVTYCESCTQRGESCLYAACEMGHLEVVKFLCERGGEALLMLTRIVSVCVDCFFILLFGLFLWGNGSRESGMGMHAGSVVDNQGISCVVGTWPCWFACGYVCLHEHSAHFYCVHVHIYFRLHAPLFISEISLCQCRSCAPHLTLNR
jgi:hypothetical protein